MTPNQILNALGPEMQMQLLRYMQDEQRAAYKAIINTLAPQRKLRPVFIFEKSKEKQAGWLLDQLRLRTNEGITEQIFQIWLLKGNAQMLITFLDTVGIGHDGKGEIAELPKEITDEKAEEAVTALMAAHPAKNVAVYLAMFQMQRPGGWPAITKAIEARPELKLA
ncbi:MAG: hypothetical protein HS117_02330 [Verrucomicrobiaceae bacterium]|jgi:hypothetical protein|nr:hypothetical protein [Verrucomicrobiaceae bacterium]